MRRIVLSLVTVSLMATACTSGWGRIGPPLVLGSGFNPAGITFAAKLLPFAGCEAVLDYFKAEALERVGPYGLEGRGPYWPIAWRGVDFAMAEPGSPVPANDEPATMYSPSNVQVAGVDEPDLVKTDGTRIISVVGGVLRYVDLTGDEPRLLGSLRLDQGWGHRILVSGDRIFVLSAGDVWAFPIVDPVADEVLVEEPAASDIDIARSGPPPMGRSQTRIVEVDASDPARLRVARTLTIDGGYVSARAVGDTARVVVSSYPDDLGFVYPSSESAEEIALEANRRVIRESTIEQWLPSFTVTDGSGAVLARGLAVPCHRMHRPAEFSGFSTLSVVTLDMNASLTGGTGTGVVASGETVYASAESLYVATSVWVPADVAEGRPVGDLAERYSTAIHRFTIDGDGLAQYRASGSVPGHLLNQFSMDEHDGVLRVAVTLGLPWGFAESSESMIVVLEERDGALVEVGSVGNMGRGEQIFSVRFMGDTAYVVTFRQVDPFYVVDLREPTAPRVTGELKIEGYSSYLHPIGEHLILGVGQDADSRGMTLGTKVTLFDVSDPANPRDVATWRAGHAYSDAEWDHLAFLAWAPADIVVVPIMSWSQGFAGAVVLSTADGLSELGRVTHQQDRGPVETDCTPVELDDFPERGVIVQVCGSGDDGGFGGLSCEVVDVTDWRSWFGGEFPLEVAPSDRIEICWPEPWPYGTPIVRSLVVGDTLWTLSGSALQGNAIEDLALRHRLDFDG